MKNNLESVLVIGGSSDRALSLAEIASKQSHAIRRLVWKTKRYNQIQKILLKMGDSDPMGYQTSNLNSRRGQ